MLQGTKLSDAEYSFSKYDIENPKVIGFILYSNSNLQACYEVEVMNRWWLSYHRKCQNSYWTLNQSLACIPLIPTLSPEYMQLTRNG